MSTSEVPPDTTSWEEAVDHGYYGERTDPLPDSVYNTTAGDTDIPVSLTSVDPAELDPATEGTWYLTCTGQFPIIDTAEWSVVIVAGNGDEWPSMDIEATSTTEINAREYGGPNYPDAAGPGYVVLRRAGEDVSEQVPFTWNYTGPPAGPDE